MFIPKEIFQNLLLGIPAIRKFAWKWHTTGINNDPEKVAALWKQILAATTTEGKNVLEIGPGRTDALLHLAKKKGAGAVFAVDVYPYLDRKALANAGIEYKTCHGRQMPYQNNFFKLIWSNDTFEHLKHPEITVSEMSRILAIGGLAVINIDLTDHYSQGKPETSLFNCLKYPDWLWKIMTSNRSAYVNRLRYSEWIKLFEANGLEIIHENTINNEVIRDCYHQKRFSYLGRLSEKDATTTYLSVILKKPALV